MANETGGGPKRNSYVERAIKETDRGYSSTDIDVGQLYATLAVAEELRLLNETLKGIASLSALGGLASLVPEKLKVAISKTLLGDAPTTTPKKGK
jgi:hypothetical protein